jgi:hypothetical protein
LPSRSRFSLGGCAPPFAGAASRGRDGPDSDISRTGSVPHAAATAVFGRLTSCLGKSIAVFLGLARKRLSRIVSADMRSSRKIPKPHETRTRRRATTQDRKSLDARPHHALRVSLLDVAIAGTSSASAIFAPTSVTRKSRVDRSETAHTEAILQFGSDSRWRPVYLRRRAASEKSFASTIGEDRRTVQINRFHSIVPLNRTHSTQHFPDYGNIIPGFGGYSSARR